ncbi:hypothetical protein BMI91_13160 [Thioclava sediminum]|uniref:Bacteriophage tail tape measure N-terminal domain-containing protein n=1 Tax=Thioclava sediminum TaxID=1915319 RepID=A0ABX3MUR5_9RHOB|nr:phage tail length tape measure family protein [Thioclava sediminum]OOY23437.1 hypothetical protein BMI91_13160 [Thioclava sediminum]
MTDKTHSIGLLIDAAPAKKGAREFTAAIASVKRAVRDLERDTSGAFTKLKTIRPEIDVTPLKSAQREAKGLAAAQTSAASASDKAAAQIQRTALASASAIRQSEQAAQRLALRLSDLGDTAGIAQLEGALTRLKTDLLAASSPLDVRAAKSGFDDLRSGLLQTTVAAEHLRGEQAMLARQTEEASRAATQEANALNALRAKYDSVYASSEQYARALSEIQQLEDAGAMSAVKAAQAREVAAQSLLAAGAANDRFAKSARVSGHETAYMAAQFNDIGVMMAAGQNPFVLALQQGTQVSQMLNGLGGRAAILRTLAAGFTSMINPVSLVTIGVIAAGAALVQWMGSGKEATKSFADSLSDAESKITALRNATDALAGHNLRNLRQEYGAVNAALDAHLERLRKVAEIEAAMANGDMVASIRDALTSDGNPFTGDIDAVARAFDTSSDRARTFLGLMKDIQSARTFDDQLAAITKLRQEVESTTGGLDKAEGGARGVLAQLIRAEDAAMKLKAASEGSGTATNAAAGAASNLRAEIGTAADEAARLLQNLGSVPNALAIMGKSVAQQITAIQAQNKSLGIQLSEGWTAAAANRRVQLQDMVAHAQETGQTINVDQVAAEYKQIQELEALGQKQAELRKQLTAANKPARKGSRAKHLTDEQKAVEKLNNSLQDRVTGLNKERVALAASASGMFQNEEAAQAYAGAAAAMGGAVDAGTVAILKQIDAGISLNKALTEAARDPVREFEKGLPSWRAAANDIETNVIGGIQSSMHDLMTGDFSLEKLGDSILNSFADALAPLATGELLKATGLDQVIGGMGDMVAGWGGASVSADGSGVAAGGAQAATQISTAMMQAGQTVAAQIGQAMTSGGVQAQTSLQSGVAMGGAQAAQQQRLAGISTGVQVRAASTQGASSMRQGIVSGAQAGAPILGAAVAGGGTGGAAGGGLLASLGGWGGVLSMALGAFKEGGISTQPVGFSSTPVAAFRSAPHYAEGTHNTSGIPAVLHPNEAVIPLSKGRKVPVEMSDGGGGGKVYAPQTINMTVNTPDADSFRKSKKQIAADMARAGREAIRSND